MKDLSKYIIKKKKQDDAQKKPLDKHLNEMVKAISTVGGANDPGALSVGAPKAATAMDRVKSAAGLTWDVFKGGVLRVGEGIQQGIGAITGETSPVEGFKQLYGITPPGEVDVKRLSPEERIMEASRGLMKIGSGGLEAAYSPYAAIPGVVMPEIKNSIAWLAENSPKELKDMVNKGIIKYESLPQDTKEIVRSALDTLGAGATKKTGEVAVSVAKEVPADLRAIKTAITDAIPPGGGGILSPAFAKAKGMAKEAIPTVETTAKMAKAIRTNLEDRILGDNFKFAQKLIEPDLKPAEKAAAIAKGQFTENVLGMRKRAPTPREVEIAKDISEIKDIKPSAFGGNNYIKNSEIINNTIKKSGQVLEKRLDKTGLTYEKDELMGILNDLKTEAVGNRALLFVGDTAAENAYMGMIEAFEKSLKGKGNKLGEVWKARKQFDDLIESLKGENILTEGRSAQARAARDVRNAVNDFIHQKMLSAGDSFAPDMRKFSNYYLALENIGGKAAKEALNPLARMYQKLSSVTKGRADLALLGIGYGAITSPYWIAGGIATYLGIKGLGTLSNYARSGLVKTMRWIETKLATSVDDVERASLLKDYELLNAENNRLQMLELTGREIKALPKQGESSFKLPEIIQGEPPKPSILEQEVIRRKLKTEVKPFKSVGKPEVSLTSEQADIELSKIGARVDKEGWTPELKAEYEKLDKMATPVKVRTDTRSIYERNVAKRAEQSLIEEAKKFKSAEGFVKAQPKLYHGSFDKIENFKLNKGGDFMTDEPFLSLTDNKDIANVFTAQKNIPSKYAVKDINKVNELVANDLKILDASDFKIVENEMGGADVIVEGSKLKGGERDLAEAIVLGVDKMEGGVYVKQLLDKGFDGIKFPAKAMELADGELAQIYSKGNEIRIFNKNALGKIKTKSQLIDIWNKAHADSKVDSLVAEAKKFKTAEEFVKSNLHLLDDSGQLQAVKDGIKPLAVQVIFDDTMSKVEGLDIIKFKAGDTDMLVAYGEGQKGNAQRLIELMQGGENTPEYHQALGELLGYTEPAIQSFINKTHDIALYGKTKTELIDIWKRANSK